MKSRREFLKAMSLLAGSAALCPLLSPGGGTGAPAVALAAGMDGRFVREAQFYKRLKGSQVQCQLCPRQCKVGNLERGYCGVRENREGKYCTLVYGNPCTVHCDPIEKKPFFHVLPGTSILSLSTAGCNLNCSFCQNWEISQSRPEQVESIELMPKDVAQAARRIGAPSIAGTYAEPVVYIEYMLAIAREAAAAGLRTVMVSSGYIEKEPLAKLCSVLAAIKIDLKGFTEEFYKKQCVAKLEPVLDALKVIRASGVWLEIVNLVIPTLNDGDRELRAMSRWIAKSLGADVPVHFTRFAPMYKLRNLPPTPVRTLERARAIAAGEGLAFVYVGNVPGHPSESTCCPACGKVVIARTGFVVRENRVKNGQCGFCGRAVPGVWK